MEEADFNLSEAALRDAVLRGDERAWRVLYDEAFDGVYGYLFFRTGRDHAWTEDAVQECWLVAVRRIAEFEPTRGPFRAWLRGIADNVLRNQRRQRQRLLAEGAAAEEAADTRPADTATLDTSELVGIALSGLPGHYREVLTDKYADQLSLAEIADRRGQTPRAIDSLLMRAKAAFRQAVVRLSGEDEQ
jgi:RNA polymerase sigma-70 factor (ECF subfamily)